MRRRSFPNCNYVAAQESALNKKNNIEISGQYERLEDRRFSAAYYEEFQFVWSRPAGQDDLSNYGFYAIITPTVQTPRKGQNLYFRYPSGTELTIGPQDSRNRLPWRVRLCPRPSRRSALPMGCGFGVRHLKRDTQGIH